MGEGEEGEYTGVDKPSERDWEKRKKENSFWRSEVDEWIRETEKALDPVYKVRIRDKIKYRGALVTTNTESDQNR